jgi:AmmeMemoRadiSam system protein B/AmmeMemoRadiSam system protein A
MAVDELSDAPVVTAPTTRPDLTPRQQELLLAACAELLCATVTGRPATYPDPTLEGAAAQPVGGAFFCLKRAGHLRGCCGGLRDRPVTLGEAVAEAVVRTALEDTRFPPVSPTELAHLDMEIWLLFNPQRVAARGEERVHAVVTGGRHGLIVRRGEHRGLLLPGVAAEHGWDARRFLEQVCVKAGLHPSLWRDDGTAVLTFEGSSLRGRVGDFEAAGDTGPPPFLGRDHLASYAGFCARNIAALLTGAVPQYSLAGVPDGTVNGLALTLRRPVTPNGLHVSQLSLRPGVALQATLFQLTQAAALQLGGQEPATGDPGAVAVGMTVLYDAALHGTVAEPHLVGLDPRRRAVLVMERGRSGLAYHPERSAEELVVAAARQAQVRTPTAAGVFSLEVASTEPSLLFSTAPQPVAGPAVRPPGVAGKFYPAQAPALARMVEELLGTERGSEAWPAAMVPHAGLRYSGHVAAAVLRRLRIPRTVIVLGPKHTGLGMEWAVAPHQTWALPGATVASDPELARQLADAIPGLSLDALAHQHEHAIEIELPLLVRLAPETRVVGLAIGHGDLESCRLFAGGLADVLRRQPEPPLLLISSDMNHFATDAETRVLDDMALTALERLDPAGVYETVTEKHISMCGVLPAVVVLETLRQLGTLRRAERVAYATSADVTGDPSRVVGYAGMLFG